VNGPIVAIFVATFLLGYIMKSEEQKQILHIADRIWWDFQLYHHNGHSSLSEDRDDFGLLFTEDYDDALEELVDWCFRQGIEAKAIWQYGTMLSRGQRYTRYKLFYEMSQEREERRPDFPGKFASNRVLQNIQLYMNSRDYAECELAFRQIAIALNKKTADVYRKYDDVRQHGDGSKVLNARITEIMRQEAVSNVEMAKLSARKWEVHLIKEHGIKVSHTYIAKLPQFREWRAIRKGNLFSFVNEGIPAPGGVDGVVTDDIAAIDDKIDRERAEKKRDADD
jgi:hypothetical protein